MTTFSVGDRVQLVDYPDDRYLGLTLQIIDIHERRSFPIRAIYVGRAEDFPNVADPDALFLLDFHEIDLLDRVTSYDPAQQGDKEDDI
jgi:hypothetical protein